MPTDNGIENGMISQKAYEKMEQIYKNNLWNYVHAYAQACDFIGRHLGDQALRRFYEERGKKRAFPALKQAAEKGVDKFMHMMHLHMNNVGGEFTYEESDNEIVVSGTCGTGGRYIREEHTGLNSEGVPFYCMHCPIWWEEMPKECGLKMSFHIGDNGVGCAWRAEK